MNKIYTAHDAAHRDGFDSSRDRIFKLFKKMTSRRRLDIKLRKEVDGEPVLARIDFGRWCASCECNGSEYVDPDDPIFYCFSCGNYANGGKLRPVVFPDDREALEEAILERPVKIRKGLSPIDRAMNAQPQINVELTDGRVVALSRSWEPGETLADIKDQNKPIKKWKENR